MPADVLLKPRKLPACDRCKSKRVLCHSQPPGIPCPRCVENEAECITSPVVRRKPVRKPKESSAGLEQDWSPSPDSAPSSSSQPTPSTSADVLPSVLAPSPYTSSSPTQTTMTSISGPLVVHLLECFTRVPQHRHPLLSLPALRQTLAQSNWRLDLLPPSTRALAFAVLATAALVSPHPSILGEGPVPTSLEELGAWPALTDWASFGRRRQGACRALTEEAFRAAREADITVNWSTESAVTCYLLDFLDSRYGPPNRFGRPFGISYASQSRALAAEWQGIRDQARWFGWLTEESLSSTYFGSQIIFSAEDHRLLYGAETVSPEEFASSLRNTSTFHDPNVAFSATLPYSIIVNDAARTLEETITGAHARRQPFNEVAALNFQAALSRLEHLATLIIQRIQFLQPTSTTTLFPEGDHEHAPPKRDVPVQYALRSISYLARTGYSVLTLAFHRELERRARELPAPTDEFAARSRERMDLLRRQVREVVIRAGHEVGKSMQQLPSLPHVTHFRGYRLHLWAQVLLDSAEGGSLSPETVSALESILQILKLTLYTYIDPAVPPAIAQIETALLPLHRIDLPPLPLDPFADYAYFDPLLTTTYNPTQDLNEWFTAAMVAFEGPPGGMEASSAM
ncbi:hypothetical protein BCR35DRAFT_298083 [Leucosporidium creatinivorum]|uniref:Zn(2)-C6 fungal-type domain-containing protein n=1 Tax=Leucosporidium creatinivorum TaxID=106004 RepID=A0A1Y2G3W8_9BASI|nr:hypothetical protein BCR35DRAFT_298083 [Leucosporidium creatinivorum]